MSEQIEDAGVLEVVITPDASRFLEAMTEANRRMQEIVRPMLRKLAELGPLIAEHRRQERDARLSQMRTAYHHRQKRRSRR